MAKDIFLMVGGKELELFSKHTGGVLETVSFGGAVDKVRQGVKRQTNQASARFKLFQQMAQPGKSFSKWFPELKEQAERCDWTNYDAKAAARYVILFQFDDRKLMRKIMAEDLKFEDAVKVGLVMEQGEKKVDEIRGKNGRKEEKFAKLETPERTLEYTALHDLERALTTKSKKEYSKPSEKEKCNSCHFGHKKGQNCPPKDKKCNDCRKKGHFKNGVACLKKKKHEKDRRLESDQPELSTDTEESVGRVKEESVKDVMALRDKLEKKSEAAEIGVTVEDHKNL